MSAASCYFSDEVVGGICNPIDIEAVLLLLLLLEMLDVELNALAYCEISVLFHQPYYLAGQFLLVAAVFHGRWMLICYRADLNMAVFELLN